MAARPAAHRVDQLAQRSEDRAAFYDPTLDRFARAMPAGLMVLDTQGRYEVPPHIQLLNAKLLEFTARVKRGEGPRWIINLPPRHAKSTTVSHYYPSWYLGTFPEDRIVLASYGAEYARGWGRRCRDTYHEHAPRLWGVGVNPSVSGQHDWETTRGGGMLTVGRGGPLTGRGANILIVDDPIKDHEEARSQAILESTYEWLRATALTRLEPGGGAILMQTRWSMADPCGRLIEAQKLGELEHGETWEVFNLPALADPAICDPDPLGRAPGEALWPTRWSRQELLRRKASSGPTWFVALYQGVPRPEEGALFHRDRFSYFTETDDAYVLHDQEGATRTFLKTDVQVIATMDPAATEGEQSAYTAIGVWGVTPQADLLALDIVREKVQTTKHKALIDGVRARWSPSIIGVEKGAYGFHILQSLAAKGYPLKPLRADKDKVARARIAEARYELRKVYHPRGAHPWLQTFEDELLTFPVGRFKDQVDILAYACSYVAFGVDAQGEEPLDLADHL